MLKRILAAMPLAAWLFVVSGCSDADLVVHGRAYTLKSECWQPYTPGSPQLAVVQSTAEDSCHRLSKGGDLTVTAFALDSGGSPIVGAYPLPTEGAGSGGVVLFAYDESCGISQTDSATASSGQVVLSQYTGGHLIGSYDVQFPTGEHARGEFDAPACSCPPADTSRCF